MGLFCPARSDRELARRGMGNWERCTWIRPPRNRGRSSRIAARLAEAGKRGLRPGTVCFAWQTSRSKYYLKKAKLREKFASPTGHLQPYPRAMTGDRFSVHQLSLST